MNDSVRRALISQVEFAHTFAYMEANMHSVLKRNGIALAAAIGILLPADLMLSAQASNRLHAQATSSKVNLTMEDRHVIKEIIKGQQVRSQPGKSSVEVGQVIPKTVQLQAMPLEVSQKVSQVRNYSYFVTDEHIVLVDPKDNKVVDVIEMN